MKNFIEDLDHFKAILSTVGQTLLPSKFKLICLLFGIVYITFQNTNIYGQPTLRSGFSMQSNFIPNHETADWIMAMAMDPDCFHYITGGYVDDASTYKRAVVSKIDPNTRMVVWQTECNISQLGSTQAAIEGLRVINGEIIAVGTELDNGYRHSLYVRLDLDGGILEQKWLDPIGGPGGRGNGNINLSDGGTMVSGNVDPNNDERQATLIKLKSDGSIDGSFQYEGPIGSTAENVIEISGVNSEVKYAVIGYLLKGQNATNPDVYIAGVKSNGEIKWSTTFGEVDVDLNGSNIYLDVNANDEDLMDCNSTTQLANSNREIGYDIFQKDGDLFFTAEFDYFDHTAWGNCTNNNDDRKDFDLVFGKMNLETGDINFLKNLERFQGDDFKPRIIEMDGKLVILGEKLNTGSNPRQGNVEIVETDYNGNYSTKDFLISGDVNCTFASMKDCDGNTIIAGNTDEHEDDYFFAKLSNSCQSSVQLGGNDIISKTTISGNITWSSSRKVKATIIIPAGAQLRIDNNAIIEFGAAWELVDYNILANNMPANENIIPKIIVMDGGTLTIDHATLKGYYACGHDWMWEGIELRKGGYVNMSNAALIEDAKIGILVDRGEYNSDGNFNPTETDGGGVITSNSSFIKNCRRCIHFANSSQINASNLSSTHFINDQGLKDPQYKVCYVNQNITPTPICQILQLGTNQFVTAYNIKGMNFSSCEWLNSRTNYPVELKGVGIGSFDADYQVNGGSSFTDLNIGIQALKAVNPKFFISVSGSNQFIRNQIGIRINGGELHKIVDGNNFELNPSTSIPVNLGNPTVFGIVNTGSTKITVRGNTFDGMVLNMPQNTSKYGFNSDNTTSASFHLNNTFTKLFMGEQTQKDNTGLNLYCNTHLLYTNSWRVFGKLGNQGNCGLNPIINITPDDKFNVPCVGTQLNHINSFTTNPFTYWTKPGDPDQPNCNSTQVSKLTCNLPNTQGGCTFVVPDIIPGNVVAYRNQIDGMDDGPFKSVIVNELLRYYFTNSLTEDADNLLATQTSVDNKFTRAMLLLDQGNYSGSIAVINSIPSASDEKADIVTFFNVISNAKQSNIAMNNLSQSSITSLESIANNRTLGAYAAQALLMAYYDKQFQIPLETDTGLQFRSKSGNETILNGNENLMSVDPSPINDECIIKLSIKDKLINAKLKVYALDGKLLANTLVTNKFIEIKIDSKLWPNGIFTVVLLNDDKIITTLKSIKN